MEMLSIRNCRAGADIMAENHIDFKYPSYVQVGPMCFDLVWSFRWVCASGKPEDLQNRYTIACGTGRNGKNSSIEIQQQMQNNIQWIKAHNKLVVLAGSFMLMQKAA
jgi:urocanate hydratase